MTLSVGVPTEVKEDERRVALTPDGVREMESHGVEVLVQQGAGLGASIPDEAFANAGAEIVADAAEVWARAGMVVKVKEPQESEFDHLRDDLTLFTYLHLAAYPKVASALCDAGTTGIAYETVMRADGALPLLAPMSEVAGRLAVQAGARFLEAPQGGRGVLLGGVPGVQPARVVVIGAGNVGWNSAWIAAGMEAEVVVLDKNVDRLRYVDQIQRGRIQTVMSSALAIERLVLEADLVIGAVLIPGARAPHLVTQEMVRDMRPGSVVVDISIDQGGCVETSHVTTHSDPVYVEHDVVHYCVGNMPGAVPRTSTYALTNVTLPYAIDIASKGLEAAIAEDAALALGVNVYRGHVTTLGVAEAHGMAFAHLDALLGPA